MLVREVRLFACALLGSLSLALVALGATPAHAEEDAEDCSAFNDPIYSRVRPSTETQLVTPWLREADGAAARYGYTEDQSVLARVSIEDSDTLTPVHRLWSRAGRGDFRYTTDVSEIQSAEAEGYTDHGPSFSASVADAPCLDPVKQYLKDGKHRLAASAGEQAELVDAGWSFDRVAFYAAPADAAAPDEPATTDDDGIFSFAVMPDTQQEVLRANDSRFLNRTTWLARQKSALDLRWVTHSGDVVNWDTPDHSQYAVADRAMGPLEQANIPFSLAVGNHDTAAVCPGGAACDPRRTRALFRDTRTFNSYFTDEELDVDGAFEVGKVDNAYSTYAAGGLNWMVLRLEMWPRASAVAWAKEVVAEHPRHNVVVITHDYLGPNGQLDQSTGYGDLSPQELFDQFISQERNIRMVFSGHVGTTANRVDTGVHGNKIYSFLQTIHSTTTNPVRLVEVDAEHETIKTWVYSPYTRQTYPEWTRTLANVDWVR